MQKPARLFVVMGVSGSGKSTIGEALAEALGIKLLDGDQFHSHEAVEKMRSGTPLDDEDRWPWFDRIVAGMKAGADEDGKSVSACSALKRIYRDYMTKSAGEPVTFIYLDGSKDLIASRMAHRQHEYMPASLLDSQFSTLEVPAEDENEVQVSIDQEVDTMVEEVLRKIQVAAT